MLLKLSKFTVLATLVGLGLASFWSLSISAEESTMDAIEHEVTHEMTHGMADDGEMTPSRFGDQETIRNHPLWLGRLRGQEQNLRMREFITALEQIKTRTERSIYLEFIDDLGVRRIVEHIQGQNPFCHGELHALGSIIRERTNNLETSFQLCQDACTYACLHGVLKAHFSDYQIEQADFSLNEGGLTPETERLKQDVHQLCKEDSTVMEDFYRGNCAHAVGHAFANIAQNVPTAKEYCTLFEEAAMQYYCQSGLFMELREEIQKKLAQNATGEKWEAEMDFCLNNTQWPSSCLHFFLGRPTALRQIDAVALQCAGLKGKSRLSCFYAAGAYGHSYIAAHPKEVNFTCQYGNATDRKLCVSGLFLRKKGHERAEALKVACQTMRDEELKSVCQDQTRRYLYQIDNPVKGLMFDEG
ncbi:MAG: hypothetical protein MCM46_12355 [Candidatus Manganitrophus sp. SB1]|nr:hypothetical protein [Candidatus Manganitrophus morganii]